MFSASVSVSRPPKPPSQLRYLVWLKFTHILGYNRTKHINVAWDGSSFGDVHWIQNRSRELGRLLAFEGPVL